MEVNGIQVQISQEMSETMLDRGILKSDIIDILEYALAGNHLYKEEENIFLGKKRMTNVTIYVEYSVNNKIEVQNIYSHRVSLKEDAE